ncbi:hypothetical protein SDJN03_00806, partial [Cucurbita argyrosperma subsp. sororia]
MEYLLKNACLSSEASKCAYLLYAITAMSAGYPFLLLYDTICLHQPQTDSCRFETYMVPALYSSPGKGMSFCVSSILLLLDSFYESEQEFKPKLLQRARYSE